MTERFFLSGWTSFRRIPLQFEQYIYIYIYIYIYNYVFIYFFIITRGLISVNQVIVPSMRNSFLHSNCSTCAVVFNKFFAGNTASSFISETLFSYRTSQRDFGECDASRSDSSPTCRYCGRPTDRCNYCSCHRFRFVCHPNVGNR